MEPYPSACIVISFKILSRLVSFTQPFALALTGRLAGCYYILSIARDQEHWVLLSILEPHTKVLYNINKRSPWTYTLSTDFLEYNLNDWNLLLSKVFSHHWQTLQWEILLHEISGEDEDEYRVDEAGNSTGEVSVSLGHSGKEDEGENHINHNLLHRIVDRILLLTHKIGEKHRRSISCKTSPGTGDVTIDRYEDNVDGY